MRFDFTKHSLSNPKTNISNVLTSQSLFSFYEFVDGETKKVVYKSVVSPTGGYYIYRDVYLDKGFNEEHVNRRTYELCDEVKFKISQDGRFVIVTNDVYGDIIIPRIPPGVRITGIEVKKLH